MLKRYHGPDPDMQSTGFMLHSTRRHTSCLRADCQVPAHDRTSIRNVIQAESREGLLYDTARHLPNSTGAA